MKKQLLLIPMLFLSIAVSAQNQKIRLQSQAPMKVSEIFNLIESQTSMTVAYNDKNVDVDRTVSVDASGMTLDQLLDHILSGTGTTVKYHGKIVAIVEEGNEHTYSGVVLDQQGPVVGAVLTVSGNQNAAVTGLDGEFSIVAQEGSVLKVSILGYKDAEIILGHKENGLQVLLEPDTELLDEVVVVGYGVQKKVNLTGSVSVVQSEDLIGRTSSNTSNLLVGAVPNMNVTNDNGRPGDGSSINIRGVNSISSGAGPYVLVDGVEGNIDRVNPNDIESISVLKDASSAAIYGAKAAFGVILITTKSGGDGDTHVDYNGRYTFHTPAVSTDFETRGYYSAALVDLFHETYQGARFTNYNDEDYYEMWIRRNDVTEHPDRPWTVVKDGKYRYYANMDWYHYFFDDKRPTNEHNVSVYGGNKKLNYRISAGYYHQDGVLRQGKGDEYTRYNMRSRISSQVNSWLKVSNNTSYFADKYPYYTRGTVKNLWSKTATGGLASVPATNPDGSAIWIVDTYATSNNRLMSGYSTVAEHGKTYNQDDNKHLSTTFEVVLTPFEGMRITGDYTYTDAEYRCVNRSLPVPYSQYPGVMEMCYDLTDQLHESRTVQEIQTANLYANYNKSINEAHNIALTAGAFYNTRFQYTLAASRQDLLSEDLNDFNLAKSETMAISGGRSRYINQGLFYRAAYDYKGIYLMEFNGRYDGSSRFPKGIRYGFFPSVSAGWRISEEPWFKPVKNVVSNFKLRASYGKLGNNEVSDYGYIQTITSGAAINYIFGGTNKATGASISAPNASDYSWEVVTSSNIGIDISFWKNKLTFSGDAYIRDTDGMFMASADLPSVYGASAPKSNAAALRSQGWEFTVDWKDSFMLAGKPFNYQIGASLADYTSYVRHYNNDDHVLGTPYTGQQLGEIWGYVVDGYFTSEEEIANHKVDQSYVNNMINVCVIDKGLHPGDLKFVDMDGDRVIAPTLTANDVKDMVVIGNSLPRFTHSLRLNAQWAGFDLSLLFNGVGRQHWYPASNTCLFWGPYARPFQTYIPQDFMSKIWTEDNPDAYFPRPRGYVAFAGDGGPRELASVNNRYLQNVAYFRLKNLTVGYSLPKKWLEKIEIEKIRFYFSGENIFTLSPIKSKYIDPAMAGATTTWKTGNTDVYGYPTAKAFSFGVDVTF
jgi:TonB-linked SusC/RagA family outer membrane protein